MKKILNKIPNKRPVVIHSDLLSFGREFIKVKKRLRSIIYKHFDKGIAIPAFVFNSKKIVDFNKKEHSLGGLTNLFISDNNFKRTLNPIHSYIINKKISIDHKYYKNSFGINSIFDYFYKKNFLWVNLGAINNDGFSIFHHAEEICQVNYRKYIFFDKIIKNGKKKKLLKYRYYARKNKINYNFDKAVKLMIKNKIIRQIKVDKKKLILYGLSKPIVNFLIKKILKNNNFLISSQ